MNRSIEKLRKLKTVLALTTHIEIPSKVDNWLR